MIRRIFGGIIAAAGLLLVFAAANELWRALGDKAYFSARSTVPLISMLGFDAAGPISILVAAVVGGLLFVAGCIAATPVRK